jgi:hypothetical protein
MKDGGRKGRDEKDGTEDDGSVSLSFIRYFFGLRPCFYGKVYRDRF